MTEKNKMLSGQLYDAADPELKAARRRARLLSKQFNETTDEEVLLRKEILSKLIGGYSHGLTIEPPFFCDYGAHISVKEHVYFNFNCVVLDVNQVTIGANVLLGPGVHIYTATHPMDYTERSAGLELGKAVTIGDDVWVGGGAIICPGINIGNHSVIGAGSVVTRDIPADVFAAGNPCRVIRKLDS